MGFQIIAVLFSALSTPQAAYAGSAGDAFVDCETAVFSKCNSDDESSPCVAAGLPACRRLLGGTQPVAAPPSAPKTAQPPTGSHAVGQIFQLDSSCEKWKSAVTPAINQTLLRFGECALYAGLKKDVQQKMAAVITGGTPSVVQCQPATDPRYCAQATVGLLILDPKVFKTGTVCNLDLNAEILHEIGHMAGLDIALEHDFVPDAGGKYDQVYSLMRYCMEPARQWLYRGSRTADVVDPDKLACMRAYQEKTVSTQADPFWIPIKAAVQAGKDPCAAPPVPAPD